MILCRFNCEIKINIKEARSRRVKAGMETDDLPSLACPLRARESRTVKRVPFSRFFFRMQDLPYLNIGIRDIKAKWRPDSGVYGIRLTENNHQNCGIQRKLRMASWDRRIVLDTLK